MAWRMKPGTLKLTLRVSVQAIVDDPLMRHSAVLVFANKQDMVRPLPLAPHSRCYGMGFARQKTAPQKRSG